MGTAKVMQNSNFSLAGELVSLTGGSSRFPFGVEETTITSELSLAFSQYDDFLIETFLGKAPTANAAETGGSVTTLTDKNGTLVDATTMIASVGVKSGSEADVKFSKYVVEAVDATTVNVYGGSDLDFARGTDKTFEDDDLKIVASALTISTGAAVEIPGFGLELNGGSGVIALTAGTTATFSARPINTKSMDVTIGGTNDVFNEFGCLLAAQNRSGEQIILDIFRVKAVGLPISFAKGEWSNAEVTAQAFYDSARDGVFSIEHVNG